ncbi:MAG: GspE/PulE family protein [Candidatus Spechtbacterales bacterium]|nr:GspE/PulE family protein [Candidatus Spechtbacterales bacterium]
MAEEKEVSYSQKNLIDDILVNSVQQRASDVHLDRTEHHLEVRFRIDGTLQLVDKLPIHLADEIFSRIKVLSEIDITEKRRPQDGHFEFRAGPETYNVRVSTLPAARGEAVALRILNNREILLPINELGFDNKQLDLLSSVIHNPNGIVLITGPTGSGKTTLLYSALNTFNKIENNIVTIEDPVEIKLDGARQAQTNESLGITFASVLRSVLRQDPDVLMVGEIRDSETAQIAFQAALAGRLVYSTFHTYDMPSLVIRFNEMGVPFSVIAQAIVGVISARLVRKVCSNCREPYNPTSAEIAMLNTDQDVTIYKARGCADCKNTGYIGRTGIFEIIKLNEDLRSAIAEQKPSSELKAMLEEQNFQSLKESALQKVQEGVTTFEEIHRVLGLYD